MPRESKRRRVCQEPAAQCFKASGSCAHSVVLCVEELESLRLCDLENLEQDDAAARMNISRGTLQRILYAARKKTASALVNGYTIRIEGGNYELNQNFCNRPNRCQRCRLKKGDETDERTV